MIDKYSAEYRAGLLAGFNAARREPMNASAPMIEPTPDRDEEIRATLERLDAIAREVRRSTRRAWIASLLFSLAILALAWWTSTRHP